MRRTPENRAAATARGQQAEDAVAARLEAAGWAVLARRHRGLRGQEAGEIDLVAEREGLLAFIEVKARADLTGAALALGLRQRARLLAAADAWMAANPGHGMAGVRFDVVLVDAAGRMRRVADAFRLEN